MKVGFMNPGNSRVGIPFGIAYIVAYLEKYNQDLEIKVFDSAYGEPNEFIKEPFDIFGLSLCFTTYRQGIELARQVRQLHPNTVIIVGGPHITSIREKTLDEQAFDYAIYGEGEITVNEVIDAIKNGADVTEIDGVIYRDEGRIVVNKPRAFIEDLDSLPFPALHHFNLDNYNAYYLLSSRGCPYGCVYCASSIWGRQWRKRSADNIIAEIESMIEKYNKNLFTFNDESFNIDIPRVNEFCDKVIAKNLKITWTCQGIRANKITLETAQKMSRAGCVGVGVGVESANPEMLKRIKKQVTIEQITNAVKVLHQAGIHEITGLFMLGNPGDTAETVLESIAFAKQQKFSRVWFNPAIPLPTTELMEFVIDHGEFTGSDDCTKHREGSVYNKDYVIMFDTPEFPRDTRVKFIKYLIKIGCIPFLSQKNFCGTRHRHNLP